MFVTKTKAPGTMFEGAEGRWYVVREDGRVVPTTSPSNTRCCISCKVEKDLTEFYFHLSKKTKRSKPDPRCKKCARLRTRTFTHTAKGQFITARNVGKQRGIPFTLTEEEFATLRVLQCHYCSGDLPETSLGLDRIDNFKGYIVGNVLPCCDNCNRTRSDVYSVDDMLIIGEAIRKVRELHGGIVPKSYYGRGRPRIKD